MTHETLEVGCLIEVENTAEFLQAHVVLDDDVELHPGDSVTVHGDPVSSDFGQVFSIRRTATITRASGLEALFTRLFARLELMELLEMSFTSWRRT